jgi:UDP-MurNAc hydroxylase
MASESVIRYLGHAGFVVEHRGIRVLIDPWFYAAFLESWFPYPDNRHLLSTVTDGKFDYLYVSHAHEDHFDRRLLAQFDRSVAVLVPRYRSRTVERQLRGLGFENIVLLDHQESHQLGEGITATMLLDTSHKEDSGLLLEMEGFRFLDLNDCNTPMSELPADIDLLAAQFSGAMWYPNCYDYPPHVMAEKVAGVRADLLDTLSRKVQLTGARAYIPSAGPACFLDPDLAAYNDRDRTIFPQWEDVAPAFHDVCPGVDVLRLAPGGVAELDIEARGSAVADSGAAMVGDLDAYRERRRSEWEEFAAYDDAPVSEEELAAYFNRLQQVNTRFLGEYVPDYRKDIRLVSGGAQFEVRLGKLAERYAIEGEEPYDPEYTLLVEPRVLRAIVEGRTGWEEALLSMRVGLHREPDVFDVTFMSLLRYGNNPAQTMQMLRERNNTETIERDGLCMQRYCPHAGEDLTFATIADGRIECPRHHWVWDAETGACIDKGSIPLRVEPAGRTESAAPGG